MKIHQPIPQDDLMKYMILGIIAFLLVGCGETFDASSETAVKISKNRIMKTLDPNEAEQFEKDLVFFIAPYKTWAEEGDGYAMEWNDIEALHGVDDDDVIDIVTEHRENVEEFERGEDLMRLRNLLAAEKIIIDNQDDVMDNVTVKAWTSFEPSRKDNPDWGKYWIRYEIKNGTDIPLGGVMMNVTFKGPDGTVKTSKVAKRVGLDPMSLEESGDYLGAYERDDIDSVIDSNGTFEVEVIDVYPTARSQGRLVVSEQMLNQIDELSRMYPEEYHALLDEFGLVENDA